MSDAIKLAIDTLQNTIDCLMRANEKNDGPICDTIWYDDHTTLFDYINCELAALRAQPIDMEKNHDDYVKSYERAQPDHSELVKRLRNFDFGSSDVDQWIEIMDEAADALEGKAIGETK